MSTRRAVGMLPPLPLGGKSTNHKHAADVRRLSELGNVSALEAGMLLPFLAADRVPAEFILNCGFDFTCHAVHLSRA